MKHLIKKYLLLSLIFLSTNLAFSMQEDDNQKNNNKINQEQESEILKAELLEAINNANKEKIIELLKNRKPFEDEDFDYDSSGHKKLKTIHRYLISPDHVADYEILNKAIDLGQIEIAKLLLELGVNPGTYLDDYFTPLLSAVENNNMELVKLCISKGANVLAWKYNWQLDPNDPSSDIGIQNALGLTAYSSNTEIMKLFLDYGIAEDDTICFFQAILIAMRYNLENKEMIKMLLNSGVDIFHEDAADQEIPESLFKLGPDAVKIFIECGVDINKLLVLAMKNDEPEIVKLLIESGANINLQFIVKDLNKSKKISIFEYAKLNNQEEIVQALINKASDIKLKLFKAVEANEYANFKKYLLQIGSVAVKDENGNNLLHLAFRKRNFALANIIYYLNPELLQQTNKDGQTPFSFIPDYIPTFYNLIHGDKVEKTLSKIFKKHGKENTLAVASRRGDYNSLKFLLANTNLKADINLPDENGLDTALHNAIILGNEKIVELLLQAGADINIEYNQTGSPQDLANWLGKEQIIDLIKKYSSKKRKLIS